MSRCGRVTTQVFIVLMWALGPSSSLGLASAQEVAPGDLVAWLRDEAGDLLTDGWVVECSSLGGQLRAVAAVDLSRGSVSFSSVPPGVWVVRGRHRTHRITVESTVTVQSNTTSELCLRTHTVPPEKRLTVQFQAGLKGDLSAAFGMSLPALTNARGETVPMVQAAATSWDFGPMDSTGHVLTCTDPRFRFQTTSRFQRGNTSKIEITGTSTLRVKAITADGVEAPPLVVSLVGGEQMPWKLNARPGASGTIHGLVASKYDLVIGFSSHRVVDMGQVLLTPDETTTVTLEAPAFGSIRGRAVDRHGQPIARSIVHIREARREGMDPRARAIGIGPFADDFKTDKSGGFVVDGLPQGEFQVWVAPHGTLFEDWIEWLVELPEGGNRTFSLQPGQIGDLHVDCAAVMDPRGVLVELIRADSSAAPTAELSIQRRVTGLDTIAEFEQVPKGRYMLIGRVMSDVDGGVEPGLLFRRSVEVKQQRSSFVQITL